MKWWNALSGKKTVIGGYAFLASIVITEVLIGKWGVQMDILPKISGTLDWIGIALTSTGGAHKFAKAIKKKIII